MCPAPLTVANVKLFFKLGCEYLPLRRVIGMCERQQNGGSLLPNREDIDVRRAVGAPHQCPQVSQKRSGVDESSMPLHDRTYVVT